MLGRNFYEPGRLFTFVGKYNSGKSTILLSEALNALKIGKKVLYVGEENIPSIINVMFRLDNEGNEYELFPTQRLINLSKDCQGLMALSSFDTSVEKIFLSIVSFKPDMVILDNYEQFLHDIDFKESLRTDSDRITKTEFYTKLKKYSMDRDFATLLGIHYYDFPGRENVPDLSATYIADLMVKIDKESAKFHCIKNRWNSMASYDMKFGQDGIIRDV